MFTTNVHCLGFNLQSLIFLCFSTHTLIYRQYNTHGGAEWSGHEERGASYLQAFGSQAHAQLQS